MKSGDVFPSRYLKAEDLDGECIVRIDRVVIEKFTDPQTRKESDKPVAYFVGVEKGLIVNKTNWALIAKQHGDESDEWTGKDIVLTVVDVEAFGDVVQAIRVKHRPAKPAKPGIGTKPTATGFARPATPRPTSEQEAADAGADEAQTEKVDF